MKNITASDTIALPLHRPTSAKERKKIRRSLELQKQQNAACSIEEIKTSVYNAVESFKIPSLSPETFNSAKEVFLRAEKAFKKACKEHDPQPCPNLILFTETEEVEEEPFSEE